MNFFETLVNKFLRLFTIRFPEMDHLPAEKRERILKRCAQNPAMGDLLAKIRPMALMPVAVAFPLFFALLFVWHWAYLPALGLFLAVFVLSTAATFSLIIALRIRVYRRLVRVELERNDEA